ncbi:hypothetical protein [Methylobacterium sp. BTF04]|uniref:hypothetical protein n=1 Tax=Methylobacterium sp. BTF04 TaxID=2708300 RepID=UPI001954683B|nr:hypothetical protein [Methylobacterium sp. BTF04]
MRIFQVSLAGSGAVLWIGGAMTENSALEMMAHEAGYRCFAAVPRSHVDDVRVVELHL